MPLFVFFWNLEVIQMECEFKKKKKKEMFSWEKTIFWNVFNLWELVSFSLPLLHEVEQMLAATN